MKAILVDKPFEIRLAEVPKPEIKNPDDVLIRVKYGSICGSDLGIYKGTNSLATYPRLIGHEYGGVVEAVGPGVRDLKPGDVVAVDPVRACGHCYACRSNRHNVCNTVEVTGVHRDGGFAEYVVAPEYASYKIDCDKVPLEVISLVEPYSIGVQVAHRGRIAAGDKVLVMGSGPIGITVMQVAKARGASVMMTDLIDARLERAKALGADVVVNVREKDLEAEVMAWTDGEGMPVIVDSVCIPSSFEQAVSLASAAGRVVTLGLVNKPSAIASVQLVKKELDVVGSRLNNYRFPEVIKGFEDGSLTPGGIISSKFPFTEAEKAIKHLIDHPEQECKVVLSFD